MEKNEPTKSKYDEALAKYNTRLDDAEVAAQVKAIIDEKVVMKNRRLVYLDEEQIIAQAAEHMESVICRSGI